MEETYALLGVDPASITTLDDYLQVIIRDLHTIDQCNCDGSALS
jgi:hypothetical protein